MAERTLLLYVHLLSMAAVVGGSLFMTFILTPLARKVLGERERMQLLAAVLKRFHPFLLLCYGLLLVSGAWMVTDVKIASGVNYFKTYGGILIWKLGLVFAALMVASYQFFGLGTGIVYAVENNLELKDAMRRLQRLWHASLANLAILFAVVYLGLRLSRG